MEKGPDKIGGSYKIDSYLPLCDHAEVYSSAARSPSDPTIGGLVIHRKRRAYKSTRCIGDFHATRRLTMTSSQRIHLHLGQDVLPLLHVSRFGMVNDTSDIRVRGTAHVLEHAHSHMPVMMSNRFAPVCGYIIRSDRKEVSSLRRAQVLVRVRVVV
jgi:hypothetical protein